MAMSERAAAAIDEFRRSRGVTNEQFENLKDLFEASPLLAKELDKVMQTGHFRFVLKSHPQQQDGYAVKHRELHLDPHMLSKANDRNEHFNRIGFLGYEVQRALHHKEQASDRDRIWEKARKISASDGWDRSRERKGALGRIRVGMERAVNFRGVERDYTGLVREHMDNGRSYQAKAEITRWNAVVSALHQERGSTAVGPGVTGQQRSRWYDSSGVDGMLPADFKLARNVMRDDQLYVTASARNIKAVALNIEAGNPAVNSAFTDRGHLGGAHGSHLYAADLVNHIAACEQRYHGVHERDELLPDVRIDAAALGLDPVTLVECAGKGEYGGDSLAHMRYVDRSDGAQCLEFDPSDRLVRKAPLKPPRGRFVDDALHSQAMDESCAHVAGNDQLKLNQDGHPDHALYCQTLDKVRALKCDLPAESRENLAAALMVEADKEGFSIHAIQLHGTEVYAMTDLERIRKDHVRMDLSKAAATPFDTSCTQWDERSRGRLQAALVDSQTGQAVPQAQASAASHRPMDEVIQQLKQMNSRKF